MGTLIGLAALAMTPAYAQTNYAITDFNKTDNIFTNLNQQFPHTDPGTGVPGSTVGAPNQTFVFDPSTYTSANAVAGANQTTNGVTFTLASDAAGHDFTEVQNLTGGTLTVPVNIPQATSVHFLAASYFNPSADFTFTASGGVSETFSAVGLHDFNAQGGPRNQSFAFNGSATPNVLDQTAFQVTDTGAGGSGNSTNGDFATYGLEEYSFQLDPAFAGQTLDLISVTADGSNPLILGITATSGSVSPTATPEPSSIALFASSACAGLAFLRRRQKARKAA
jgi:hypothetical protein